MYFMQITVFNDFMLLVKQLVDGSLPVTNIAFLFVWKEQNGKVYVQQLQWDFTVLPKNFGQLYTDC